MENKKHIRTVGIVLLALFMTACSTLDTPYDPDFNRGETLFDQLPNWDGEALHRCGAMDVDLPQHKTRRC